MKSILITGGSGAFGEVLAGTLLNYPWPNFERIIIYSRGEFRQFQMAQHYQFNDDGKKLRFMIGDVRDRDRLKRAMQGIDVVVHAAALKRIEVGNYNPIEMVKTNVGGAINVIEAAQDAGVKKVVALSSDKAFQPISPYGTSKALAESIFLAANNTTGQYGPKFSVCRYGNVWWSTGSVAPTWKAMLDHNPNAELPVTDPECTRFFMRMSEAVALVIKTIISPKIGELAIPQLPAYRLGDLAEAMGAKIKITGLPPWEKRHEGMHENLWSNQVRRMSIDELKKELHNA